MKIVCQREPTKGEATVGSLTIDGGFECYTLEDAVREVKIHGRTAIPTGTYRVSFEHSPRFGPATLTLNDVPGFGGIRVHGGNTFEHTEGCPLVGDAIDRKGESPRIVAGTSQPALRRLKGLVQAALDAGDDVTWEVRNVSYP